MGPVCQALILLQLLRICNSYQHPDHSCLLQTCAEGGKCMLSLSVRDIPEQPPICMCAPNVSFLPFLKVGGRLWSHLLFRQDLHPWCSTFRNLACYLRNVIFFSYWQGQVFPISSSAEYLCVLFYTASLHFWSQHWGIFSSDWRDTERIGRTVFFFQRGKILETFLFCCKCKWEPNPPFEFIAKIIHVLI